MLKKEKFMKEAIKQAKKAYDKEEIPVGAVIVKDGKIIARGYNKKEEKKDTTQHAEIIAIQKASRKICYTRAMCNVYRSINTGKVEKGIYRNNGSKNRSLWVGT